MGKNNSKRKPVTHYQQMVSGMRKVDNYLLKQKMEAKKKKEKDKTQNKQMIHTGYAILKLIKHYMQLKITNEIVISQDKNT